MTQALGDLVDLRDRLRDVAALAERLGLDDIAFRMRDFSGRLLKFFGDTMLPVMAKGEPPDGVERLRSEYGQFPLEISDECKGYMWMELLGTLAHVRGCVELLMRSLKPKRKRSAPAKGDALTVNSVARQLHVSPDTVRGWIKSGQLKASNLATGPRPRYAIIQDELDAFLKRREAQPPAKRERKAQATVAFKRYRA